MDGEAIKEVEKKIEFGIGEIILLFFILLNILEFARILPYDLDYVKKIISWAALGYLLYQADLIEIIFGYKDRLLDAALIIAYFLMIMKNFIVFAKSAVDTIGAVDKSLLMPLYLFVLDHAYELEIWSFFIGAGMLILIACLNLVLNFEVRAPSIMAMMHEEGEAADLTHRIKRTITTFLVFVVFFIFVFNLIMEWLAWVIDSSLLVLGILFYFFFFIKYSRRFDTTHYVYKVGNVGSDFYKNAVRLFHSKGTFMIGVLGILVLHLITDGGVFILPYIMGKNINYFTALGAGHDTIISLASFSLAAAHTALMKALVIAGYALNSIGAFILLIGPAFFWYELYTNRRIGIPRIVYLLFYSSVIYLLLNPVFSMARIGLGTVSGVDIITNLIAMDNIMIYTAISAAAGVIAFALTFSHIARRAMKYVMFTSISIFFFYYIILYSLDIVLSFIQSLVNGTPLFIKIYLVIFIVSTAVFYFTGGMYFIYMNFYKLHKKEV